MAFSTQKDFFNVPFMNESIESDCIKACVKLKSYESTIDNRSWASDEEKQSKFLSDLVTCQYPVRICIFSKFKSFPVLFQNYVDLIK